MTLILIIFGLIPLFIARATGKLDTLWLPMGIYATITVADFLMSLPVIMNPRRHESNVFLGAALALILGMAWLWAMFAATAT